MEMENREKVGQIEVGVHATWSSDTNREDRASFTDLSRPASRVRHVAHSFAGVRRGGPISLLIGAGLNESDLLTKL